MTVGVREAGSGPKTGGMRKAAPVLMALLAALLLWAWWDGGEQSLTAIEQPVELPPELTGDLAEGQQ